MEKEADEVLELLENHGFSSFKVGGYVRDKLLGLPVHDIDIATAARPEQVMAIFPHSIPTGIKHGTVTVRWKGCTFEVTTFRKESGYHDHRRPDRIEYVSSIETDLGRRDFTINAMAMNRRGEVIDPFGGQKDLAGRVLRAVGDARQRFQEDALRILRGIRFSARFDLVIAEETWEAMRESGKWLQGISRERIRDELRKIIEGDRPVKGIACLAAEGLLPFPCWRSRFQEVQRHPCACRLTDSDQPAIRWSMIFFSREPRQVYSFLLDWRFPKKLAQEVAKYLEIIHTDTVDERTGKALLLSYGREKVILGFRLRSWFYPDKPPVADETWSKWDREIPVRGLKDLCVKPADLLHTFKKKPGPWVGKAMNHLFEQVAFQGLPNDRTALLAETRKVIDDEHERKNSPSI